MARDWLEPEPVEVPYELQQTAGGHPLVAATLARRGINTPAAAAAFLDPDLYTPTRPGELPDLESAAERLEQAMDRRERILVWGDFDVDGQTATTVLVEALTALGGQVQYHIPVRAQESHGVNLPVLQELLKPGIEVLLTCDTGIAAHAALQVAVQQGVTVIVTDHHDLPRDPQGAPDLPPAYAVVNPRRLPADHPLADLPGVGVAYKLVEELYRRRGRMEDSAALLDLVALGALADLAILRRDTRYLVQRGLEALRHTSRLGLQILIEQAEIDPAGLNEEHVGFGLAPRLNAIGRLGDANPVVELLTTADRSRARVLALQLEGLNAERRLLTSQVYQGALAQLDADPSLGEQAALVLAHPAWPAGVIGIVASQLVERFHKPTILLAAPPGEPARGSARSIPGVNISAAIAAQAEWLLGFGGHPMAAGLSLAAENIPGFRRAFNRSVAELRQPCGLATALPLEPPLALDGVLALEQLSLELAADLERLAPFGPGNPSLVLASREVHVHAQRKIGRGSEHRLLEIADETGQARTAIWWGGGEFEPPGGAFDLAYTLRASSFGGRPSLQLQWIEARLQRAPHGPAAAPAPIQFEDYRQSSEPGAILAQLRAASNLTVWAEGEPRAALSGALRTELHPAARLVIATCPPGPLELAAAFSSVAPQKVYLLAVDPGMDEPRAFLERLAGVIKYLLRTRQGQTSIHELAAATAQRPAAVSAGLEWLANQGHLRYEFANPDKLFLQSGAGENHHSQAEIEARLRALLAETRAYRAFYRLAPAAALLAPLSQPQRA